jgi:hypothetical protein
MAIKLDSGFEILRFSDMSFEEMTVEIQFNGEQIAQLNKDKGFDEIEIELLKDFLDPNFIPKFRLVDYLTALNEAKRLLLE